MNRRLFMQSAAAALFANVVSAATREDPSAVEYRYLPVPKDAAGNALGTYKFFNPQTNQAKNMNGVVRFVDVQGNIKNLVEIANLDSLIPFYKALRSTPDAVALKITNLEGVIEPTQVNFVPSRSRYADRSRLLNAIHAQTFVPSEQSGLVPAPVPGLESYLSKIDGNTLGTFIQIGNNVGFLSQLKTDYTIVIPSLDTSFAQLARSDIPNAFLKRFGVTGQRELGSEGAHPVLGDLLTQDNIVPTSHYELNTVTLQAAGLRNLSGVIIGQPDFDIGYLLKSQLTKGSGDRLTVFNLGEQTNADIYFKRAGEVVKQSSLTLTPGKSEHTISNHFTMDENERYELVIQGPQDENTRLIGYIGTNGYQVLSPMNGVRKYAEPSFDRNPYFAEDNSLQNWPSSYHLTMDFWDDFVGLFVEKNDGRAIRPIPGVVGVQRRQDMLKALQKDNGPVYVDINGHWLDKERPVFLTPVSTSVVFNAESGSPLAQLSFEYSRQGAQAWGLFQRYFLGKEIFGPVNNNI